MIAFLVWASLFLYGILAFVWSKSDWFNVIIKFIFTVLTVLCIVILYKYNGFSGFPIK